MEIVCESEIAAANLHSMFRMPNDMSADLRRLIASRAK
jgi:hypothetical protein